MKTPPIIVTGVPRSGTSFVAGFLHTKLSVDMGSAFRPPYPGREDFEFEDIEVAERLIEQWQSKCFNDFEMQAWFYLYCKDRQSRHLWFNSHTKDQLNRKLHQYWGVKSPLFLLFPNIIPEDAYVITTKRDIYKSRQSVMNLPVSTEVHQTLWKLIEECNRSLPQLKADLTVDLDVLSTTEAQQLIEEKVNEFKVRYTLPVNSR